MDHSEVALRLAVAKNAATNGRLFCVLLAAANYAAGYPLAVALAALPVGLAWAADLSQKPGLKLHLSVASVSCAAGLAIATLVNCW